MKISGGLSLTLLGLIIGTLGVVSPIAWDWWNKRAQLTIETKSSVSIVSISQPIKSLVLTYNSRKVSELRKITLIVRNSGRTPITKDDVIAPLTMTFLADELLEATIVRQVPVDLNPTITATKNTVTLAFTLLNPRDEAEVEVLTAGKYSGYTATARIKNIDAVEIADISRAIKIRNYFSFGVYVAGAFGLLFALAAVSLLFEIPASKRARAALQDDSHRLLHAQSRGEALGYLKSDLGFLSGSRLRRVRDKVSTHAWPLDDSSRNELKDISIMESSAENSLGGAILAFALAGLALWYVLSNVIAR
jgi:hypothetical protein